MAPASTLFPNKATCRGHWEVGLRYMNAEGETQFNPECCPCCLEKKGCLMSHPLSSHPSHCFSGRNMDVRRGWPKTSRRAWWPSLGPPLRWWLSGQYRPQATPSCSPQEDRPLSGIPQASPTGPEVTCREQLEAVLHPATVGACLCPSVDTVSVPQ